MEDYDLANGGHYGASAKLASRASGGSETSNYTSGYWANVTSGLAENYREILVVYWQQMMKALESEAHDYKLHSLPLARIKKVMKVDPEVKMISAEAPVLFAKTCEMFITELTMRAWIHAEENKRRTLQRSDIAAALSKSDMFDFLIDIVPREEANAQNKRSSAQGGGSGGQLPSGAAIAHSTHQLHSTLPQDSLPPSDRLSLSESAELDRRHQLGAVSFNGNAMSQLAVENNTYRGSSEHMFSSTPSASSNVQYDGSHSHIFPVDPMYPYTSMSHPSQMFAVPQRAGAGIPPDDRIHHHQELVPDFGRGIDPNDVPDRAGGGQGSQLPEQVNAHANASAEEMKYHDLG